jgi:hypothetical protein
VTREQELQEGCERSQGYLASGSRVHEKVWGRLQVEPLEPRWLARAEVMFQRQHDEIDNVLHVHLDIRQYSISLVAVREDGWT